VGRASSVAGRRRRGNELVEAIHAATLAELAENGYERLTVEAVAERAHVGKASIYRRWPGKLDLTLDAIDGVLPDLSAAPDTGTIRGDLIVVLRSFVRAMNGPCGAVLRGSHVKTEELTLAIKQRLIEPRLAVLLEVMRRAVDRGEVRSDAARTQIAEVGPMLLHAELMREGRITERSVVALVDDVLLPMLRP
jgi:AcrR family transcriptional regulator